MRQRARTPQRSRVAENRERDVTVSRSEFLGIEPIDFAPTHAITPARMAMRFYDLERDVRTVCFGLLPEIVQAPFVASASARAPCDGARRSKAAATATTMVRRSWNKRGMLKSFVAQANEFVDAELPGIDEAGVRNALDEIARHAVVGQANEVGA